MSYSNSIQSLWTEAKNYLELQKEYLKLDSAEKLSRLLSAIVTVAVCLTLGLVALFFFVIALAFWLAKLVGAAWSFTIMGGVMVLFIIIVFVVRKRWIVQPIARFVAGLLVGEDDEMEDEI